MDEDEFWLGLEYRVCAELAGMTDSRFRSLWCDGFLSLGIVNHDREGAWVEGTAWIMGGAAYSAPRRRRGGGEGPYRFRLRVGEPGARMPTADWSILLPADGMTGWLFIDPANRYLQINPAVAVPDDAASD
jgi:hypothetical protein